MWESLCSTGWSNGASKAWLLEDNAELHWDDQVSCAIVLRMKHRLTKECPGQKSALRKVDEGTLW